MIVAIVVAALLSAVRLSEVSPDARRPSHSQRKERRHQQRRRRRAKRLPRNIPRGVPRHRHAPPEVDVWGAEMDMLGVPCSNRLGSVARDAESIMDLLPSDDAAVEVPWEEAGRVTPREPPSLIGYDAAAARAPKPFSLEARVRGRSARRTPVPRPKQEDRRPANDSDSDDGIDFASFGVTPDFWKNCGRLTHGSPLLRRVCTTQRKAAVTLFAADNTFEAESEENDGCDDMDERLTDGAPLPSNALPLWKSSSSALQCCSDPRPGDRTARPVDGVVPEAVLDYSKSEGVDLGSPVLGRSGRFASEGGAPRRSRFRPAWRARETSPRIRPPIWRTCPAKSRETSPQGAARRYASEDGAGRPWLSSMRAAAASIAERLRPRRSRPAARMCAVLPSSPAAAQEGRLHIGRRAAPYVVSGI